MTNTLVGPHRAMRAQDSLWLHLDRPANRLVITSVLWTETPIDTAALREIVADRILARFPVYLQRPVPSRVPGKPPIWETDPDFDLSRHFVVCDMPAPGDARALQDFVAAERSRPFESDHPLWSIHLLHGYGNGSALVMRSHHAMADGIRLTQVMFSLLDPLDGAPAKPSARVGGMAPRHENGVRPVTQLSTSLVREVDELGLRFENLARRLGPLAQAAVAVPAFGATAAAGVAGAALDIALSALPAAPRGLADRLATTGLTLWHSAESVAKLLGWPGTARLWEGEPGIAKTAVWGRPIPLAALSRIGHTTGTTVNDVCTALVAGALDRYLAEHKRGGAGLRDVVWMLPVSLEKFDTRLPPALGNHFSLVLAHLPLGRGGFHERLAEVHRRVLRIRDSYEPLITYALQEVVSQSPPPIASRLIRFFTDKAIGVLTNVPGPSAPMQIAGARVAGVVGWAPTSGRQAITVCVFTYAGQVFFGFGTDQRLIPDADRLVAALEAEVRDATRVIPLDEKRLAAVR
ncbi:DUF1298 domain-containing protein [Amycolatopsis sp. K13G38]|uniref:diacylglycerol O-acyltransferase n=1 Tax=Amycolatopsis acididurans TaxID=2724524 RepID=A0ABX1J8W2_9PSEU|nr:WS/DGAT domain-containing protein [Amycolatopsis acididurans]NKQ56235.1 DUF1298 domain-containing protein [Amycolatopsis acididurans]